MKTTVLIAALLLAGCAKRYQVCISTQTGVGCMHNDLAKKDAINVGQAFAGLGYDVIVQPKANKPNTQVEYNGPGTFGGSPNLTPAPGTNGSGDIRSAPDATPL